MLTAFKRTVLRYLASDAGYRLFGARISRLFSYIANSIEFVRLEKNEKKKIEQAPGLYKINQAAIDKIVANMMVLNGPFKGMRYPHISVLKGKYISGAIYSKIVGCYERELHPIVYYCLEKEYSDIVTIGSAEGYYTIGLGMQYPNARHIAFDVDQNARILCGEIAALNGLKGKIAIQSFCSSQTLQDLKISKQGLIICDCEGYEMELFTPASVKNLQHCDLLVELHDFENANIYPTLHELFKDTHNEKIIENMSDAQKIREYNYAEFAGLNTVTINSIVSEHRPQQEWLFLEAKI